MTQMLNLNPLPTVASQELTLSLTELLQAYIKLLTEERAGQWSQVEEDLVRRARTALTNAGSPPELGHEITAHLDYRLLDGDH